MALCRETQKTDSGGIDGSDGQGAARATTSSSLPRRVSFCRSVEGGGGTPSATAESANATAEDPPGNPQIKDFSRMNSSASSSAESTVSASTASASSSGKSVSFRPSATAVGAANNLPSNSRNEDGAHGVIESSTSSSVKTVSFCGSVGSSSGKSVSFCGLVGGEGGSDNAISAKSDTDPQSSNSGCKPDNLLGSAGGGSSSRSNGNDSINDKGSMVARMGHGESSTKTCSNSLEINPYIINNDQETDDKSRSWNEPSRSLGIPQSASRHSNGHKQAVVDIRQDRREQQQLPQPRLDQQHREQRPSMTSRSHPPLPPPPVLVSQRSSLAKGAPSSSEESFSHRISAPGLLSDIVAPANMPNSLPPRGSHGGDSEIHGHECSTERSWKRSDPSSSARPDPPNCHSLSSGIEDSSASGIRDEIARRYGREWEQYLETFAEPGRSILPSLSSAAPRSPSPWRPIAIGSHREGRMREERVSKGERQRDNRCGGKERRDIIKSNHVSVEGISSSFGQDQMNNHQPQIHPNIYPKLEGNGEKLSKRAKARMKKEKKERRKNGEELLVGFPKISDRQRRLGDDRQSHNNTLLLGKTPILDSLGRCYRCVLHPHNQFRKKKLFGQGWNVIMTACPDCCIEELRRIRKMEEEEIRRKELEAGMAYDDGANDVDRLSGFIQVKDISSRRSFSRGKMRFMPKAERGRSIDNTASITRSTMGSSHSPERKLDSRYVRRSASVDTGGHRQIQSLQPASSMATISNYGRHYSADGVIHARSEIMRPITTKPNGAGSDEHGNKRPNSSKANKKPHGIVAVSKMEYNDREGLHGHYSGRVNVNFFPHGLGVMVYDNGSEVEGDWVNGCLQGETRKEEKPRVEPLPGGVVLGGNASSSTIQQPESESSACTKSVENPESMARGASAGSPKKYRKDGSKSK